MRSPRRRRVFVLAFVAGCTMLLVVWSLHKFARSMIFPHDRIVVPQEQHHVPGLERVWLEREDGAFEVWILPGAGVDAQRPGPALIFAHGNGELIDFWPSRLERYRALGVSVVLPEYPGYGRSGGVPSERSVREGLQAVIEHVRADPRIDAERLVYHGRSLGGGAVGSLLATHPPRGLVLESTFTSVPDVTSWAPRFIIPDHFDTMAALPRYAGPVLVIHGTRDGVIAVAHGHRLAAAAPHAELVLYDAGHNDLPPPGSDYWERIEAFLARAGVLVRP